MFDWDKDYDGLVRSGSVDAEHHMADARVARRFPKKMPLAAAAICAGFACHALATKALDSSDLPQMRFLDPVTFSQADFPGKLQVFDNSHRDRFQNGLRAFSQPDLARYASTTRTDLEMAAIFMQPYLADALALIEHELARRGI